jgi:coproporphyrinogen III oxidase
MNDSGPAQAPEEIQCYQKHSKCSEDFFLPHRANKRGDCQLYVRFDIDLEHPTRSIQVDWIRGFVVLLTTLREMGQVQ